MPDEYKYRTMQELEEAFADKRPKIEKRYSYKEAFIMSPKLGYRVVQVRCISDGIAILNALGEGKLMVSTQHRNPKKGYFPMAECDISELIGKAEQEIYQLLDERTDNLRP